MRTNVAAVRTAIRHGAAREPLRWWREVALLAIMYGFYSQLRNVTTANPRRALANAHRVIELEHRFGLFHEARMQASVVHWSAFIVGANYYYGTAHFVLTAGALIVLYRKWPGDYARLRNALAGATVAALVGFAFVPVMPPRLLPSSYGFVDTLARYGSPWSFDSGPLHRVSNQFAAMPSVHIAWALWVTLALRRRVRHRAMAVIVYLHPFLTLAVVVATANHYILDAIAGAALMLTAYGITTMVDPRRPAPTESSAREIPTPPRDAEPPRGRGDGHPLHCVVGLSQRSL